MGRLGLLIVLLAVVVAAAIVVQLRVAPEIALSGPEGAAPPKKLSRADQKKLEVLKDKFAKERDTFLQLRSAGAPQDKLDAQNAKARAAAQAVIDLGGTEAIKSVGRSKFAPTSVSGPGDRPDQAASSCSGEGGTCSVDLGAKSAAKPESKEAKPAGTVKPASPATPATKP